MTKRTWTDKLEPDEKAWVGAHPDIDILLMRLVSERESVEMMKPDWIVAETIRQEAEQKAFDEAFGDPFDDSEFRDELDRRAAEALKPCEHDWQPEKEGQLFREWGWIGDVCSKCGTWSDHKDREMKPPGKELRP